MAIDEQRLETLVVESKDLQSDAMRDAMRNLALIGVFGGLFIVPLYALILSRSAESHRARIIACNNILNAGFMVIAAVLAIVWLELLHLSIPQLFILAAVLNALVATYIYTLVPEFLMRFLSWVFVSIMYRIKVRGFENIPETGPALIVSNHVSFMDALVIGGNVRFAPPSERPGRHAQSTRGASWWCFKRAAPSIFSFFERSVTARQISALDNGLSARVTFLRMS